MADCDVDDMFNHFMSCGCPSVTKDSQSSSMYDCPYCKRPSLSVDEGNVVCTNCLRDFGSVIDDNAEWRSYNNDDSHGNDPTRCGGSINPLLVESSFGTTMGYSKNNYFNHLKQLNTWQSMPHHERSLKLVFDKLTQSGMSRGLPSNIIEFSHSLFAEVIQRQTTQGETKLSRGDNRDGLIAACLFYSCKEYDVPRSPQEIGKICGVLPSDVTRGIKLFYELMKDSNIIDLNRHITKYTDFIERYCNNLGIDAQTMNNIVEIGQKVDQLKILTKNTPQAIACGCIYFVVTMYNLNVSKTYIAEKCGISVPTITKSYERLLPYTCKLV